MISPVHIKVPGRARFRVSQLYANEPLKLFLESSLPQHPLIHQTSASTTTGNLLVLFDSGTTHGSMAEIIERVLEGGPVKTLARNPELGGRNPLPALPASIALPGPGHGIGKIARLKDKFVQMLGAGEAQREEAWHLLEAERVFALIGSDPVRGLTEAMAEERLKRYGPNALPESSSRSWWEIFAGQFVSLPVALLGAAAGLSLVTGGLLDAVVIMGVVAMNGVIGTLTESKAEKTIQSLKRAVRPIAQVVRGGCVEEIPGEELVVGDLLVFKPGSYVAADCRVIEASHLSIDESVLTGESMPVTKRTVKLEQADTPLADRINMAYMGTLVTGGEGLAVVVATGNYTEIGHLQMLLDETVVPETPIERQLKVMGDQLVVVCLVISGAVFLLGFLRGYGVLQVLRMAVSLAAAAVPEGLPAAATINFALGIERMRAHRILIRRLQAVETLGAVQTVCLDKTGTITRNQMTVLRLYAGMRRVKVLKSGFRIEGDGVPPLDVYEVREIIRAGVLCSETKINGGQGAGYVLSGSPTENALVDLAVRADVDCLALRGEYPLIQVNHRSENRLFMSTFHRTVQGKTLHVVKGSPPEVLAMCDSHMVDGVLVPITEEDRRNIEVENQQMAGDALRVLGVCFGEGNGQGVGEDDHSLCWLGLVGMADPIREGVENLIGAYHRAGINTVMITGDQSPTAYAVARALKLSEKEPLEILDSTELTSLPPDLLQALASKVHVYSRVSPAHKLKIVRALQSAGRTVAMTGDGINDGPALKAADIGIAMGISGTDVAREVADVVLEDDNLETLIIAVKDGRATYSNIRKSVHFFLSTNFTEIMVMFAATALGLGFPLTVMQLLWINIISDIFPGLALSMEEPEPDVLDRPPRDPRAELFAGRDYRKMARESAVISAGSLAAFGYGIARYGAGAAASSLAFQSLTIGQLLHALSCRSEKHTVFDSPKPPSNPYLNAAIGGSVAIQVLTMFVPPLRRFLGLVPPGLLDLAVIGTTAVMPFFINEAVKKRGRNETP